MRNRELINIAKKRLDRYKAHHLKEIGILPTDDNHHIPTITYPSWKGNFRSNYLKGITCKDFDSLCLYIHIPFCPTSCSFCQFDTCLYTSSKEIDKYISYMKKEITIWKNLFPSLKIAPATIFIGGGTPSILNPSQWEKLFHIIHSEFDLKKCDQFSIDVEPRTLCCKKGINRLKAMKKGGINRICLGTQSFNDSILKLMRRPHNSKDILEATQNIRKVGFDSLLLDLIFGYPQCTLDSWINDLQTADKLGIDGYQLYQLRIINFRPKEFKKTTLKKEYKEKPMAFLSLQDVYLMKMLNNVISEKNGYKQYGRGTYLKSAKHNSQYLKLFYNKRFTCLGIGKGAFTGIKQHAFLNLDKSLNSYYNLIDKGELPFSACTLITRKKENEALFIMPLKNCGIVNKKYFEKKSGTTAAKLYGKKINQLKKLGLMREDKNNIYLTKKGLFFDDDILFHFYDTDEIPLPKSAYQGPMNPFKRQ